MAVSLGGSGGRRAGTQEVAWQPESHRAEPPTGLWRGLGPSPGCYLWKRKAQPPWEERGSGQGSSGPVTSTRALERVTTPS